jgi:hypothetical protein
VFISQISILFFHVQGDVIHILDKHATYFNKHSFNSTGNNVDVPTARGAEANEKLRRDWEDPKFRLTGQRWGTYNNSFYKEVIRSFVLVQEMRASSVTN